MSIIELKNPEKRSFNANFMSTTVNQTSSYTTKQQILMGCSPWWPKCTKRSYINFDYHFYPCEEMMHQRA